MIYVRTAEGECYDAPDNEAVEQFLSSNGYRITFSLGDYEFVLRRVNEVEVVFSEFLQQRVTPTLVTVRGGR